MRIIDADKLLCEIEEELSYECKAYTAEQNKWIDTGLRIAATDIRHQPTVNAVEVVHGRWIDAREYCGDYMCSNCDALYGTNKFKYCPNCGAKMDGGNEDGKAD